MIVLSIESATIEVGVGLARDGLPIGALTARPGLRHVETLHPAIQSIIAAAGISLIDIDAIAVDIGPGLFTGLRVGIAAAKALAFGLRVPTIAIRSTDVLVRQTALSARVVIPVIDMRRSEIAWSLANKSTTGIANERDITLGTPEQLHELLGQLLSQNPGDYLLVGDGTQRYADRIIGTYGDRLFIGEHIHDAPSATTLAIMGCELFGDARTIDPFEIAPLYFRDADATVNFAVRDGVRAIEAANETAPESAAN